MNAKVLTNSEKDMNLWRDYYLHLPYKAVYHSPDYLRVLEGHFGETRELFIYERENDYIYYPYLKKRISELPFAKSASINLKNYWDINSSWYYGGPLASSKTAKENMFLEFKKSFREYAYQNNIVSEFIRFDANLKNYLYYLPELIEFNRETVFVDLKKDLHEIWSDFTSANRRAIRKSQKSEYQINIVEKDDVERWKEFCNIYNSEMRRKDAPQHLYFEESFFFSLKNKMSGNVKLLTVEKQGELCGGFIIIFDDYFAFHFLSASLPKYWPDRINNLLFYEAILWAKDNGCTIFDFMGGRAGVFRFKTNFSSSRRKFYTYRSVHNKEIYNKLAKLYRQFFKLEKTHDINYFPFYRYKIKNI